MCIIRSVYPIKIEEMLKIVSNPRNYEYRYKSNFYGKKYYPIVLFLVSKNVWDETTD